MRGRFIMRADYGRSARVKITDVRSVIFWGGSKNMLVAVVETDEGIRGYGEAGGGESLGGVAGAIESLGQRIVGEDATRVEHLWQLMFRGGFFPGGNILGAAVSAI